jgi:hypothetical protein
MEKPVAERVAARALTAASSWSREEIFPLLATNLAVMLSARYGHDPLNGLTGNDDSIGARAFRFATLIYGRAQDDWYHHGRSHVGTSVLPGVLSVDCEDIYGPVAAGYAAMMAVSGTYGIQAHTHALRPTSMFGGIGAAAAATYALGGGEGEIARALAFALVGSCGHSQCMIEGTDEWRYEVANGIRAGAEGARLAFGRGVAARLTFEGESGWAAAHFDDPGAQRLLRTLERPLEPINAVTVKPYPASGVAMATIATAAAMGEEHGAVSPECMEVACSPAVVAVPGSLGRPPYKNQIGAAMSLAYCAAEAYVTGTMKASAASADRGRIAELDARTGVIADETLADGQARIDIWLDGQRISRTGDAEALLRPTTRDILDDADAVAARYEVVPAAFRALLDLLGAKKVGSADLRAFLFAHTPTLAHV